MNNKLRFHQQIIIPEQMIYRTVDSGMALSSIAEPVSGYYYLNETKQEKQDI